MASIPERLDRFQREARAVAALDHPHIVTIHSVEQADGVPHPGVVEGQRLDQLVAESALAIERIVGIGTAIADALTAAHERGIVHRDLKPANVVVAEEGEVKVLDFDLSKMRPLGEAGPAGYPGFLEVASSGPWCARRTGTAVAHQLPPQSQPPESRPALPKASRGEETAPSLERGAGSRSWLRSLAAGELERLR
jgi:serine/threonine protein kinase